jgi:serine O-acetyltransferase
MNRDTVKQLMEAVRDVVFYDKGDVFPPLAALVGEEKARSFIAELPELKRELLTDVEAIASNDPAASDREEIIACYPGIIAMLSYRTAHRLLLMDIPVLPRFITEMAHSATGIDIHPAARIGDYFAIDHGTGIVIGATAVIGSHVMLYQGVTLGARNFHYDEKGHPLDVPRHPILEDNVTVYSNTSILGNVRIGHDTIIGGNIWLTHDVPPNSRIRQGNAIYVRSFENGEGI